MICSLCSGNTSAFLIYREQTYFRCKKCESILLNPDNLPKPEFEKFRYDMHSDDIESEGYQNFVAPLVNEVTENFLKNDSGLDYGCGKTAIVQILLQRKGFQIKGFDPIYKNETSLLNKKYNYITCCEVAEHFHYPALEFKKLSNLLLPKGKLILKTHLYNDTLNFEKWWYKNDPTHVFFYTEKSLQFIKETFDFKELKLKDKYVVFCK